MRQILFFCMTMFSLSALPAQLSNCNLPPYMSFELTGLGMTYSSSHSDSWGLFASIKINDGLGNYINERLYYIDPVIRKITIPYSDLRSIAIPSHPGCYGHILKHRVFNPSTNTYCQERTMVYFESCP